MRCSLLVLLLVSLPVPAAVDPDDPEGIGADMGYRMYGTMRKNAPLLLQNSRPHPVQVFDEQKGVYVQIPSWSDRDFPCRGKARVLHVRFVDSFGESAPFQVRIGCGRELQFIAREQTVSPQPGAAMPANAPEKGAAGNGATESAADAAPATPAREASPPEAAPVASPLESATPVPPDAAAPSGDEGPLLSPL
ncbi:MAG: hypothetical protein ACOY33_08150 [Pseudomonadota bacterium]